MKVPNHVRLATLVALGLSAALGQGAPQATAPDSPEAKQARLAWFKDAKFGLFIHWGLYAIPAGEWKGKHVPGIGEWIMNRAGSPVAEYEQLAKQWSPVKFDPDAWVQMAQDAGMKYIVITSKHHDGFALFDSKVTRWDVVDATPFKRDILKELSAACQKHGMPLGFYYSQAQDWHEPGGAGNNVIPAQVQNEAWEVPATINHTWGFRKDDQDWKSPGEVTFKLVDIVSKGGNYLLNVGPTAEGVIPQGSQETLRTVGRWLKVNGEAVYGAGPTPWGEELGEPSAKGTKDLRGNPLALPHNEWRVTTRPGRLYFIFFQEPRAPFELPPMKNAVKRAYRLADAQPVEGKVENGRPQLVVARPIHDPMATVVVVEVEGDKVER